MLLRYVEFHAGDVYHMLNLETVNIMLKHDI